MAYDKNITSADATVYLIINDLFPAGVKLEQFSTDAMVAMGDDVFAETRMGVDGQMVAGYVDQIKSVTITLEPSSPSIKALNTLQMTQRAQKKLYSVTLVITIPSTGMIYTFINGVLKQGKLLPDVGNVLAPVPFVFDFERVNF